MGFVGERCWNPSQTQKPKPNKKTSKKKAESFSTIPGGDRRNSDKSTVFQGQSSFQHGYLIPEVFFGVVASFFSKALVANSDKTNRSLPNLHVPHKGQWPEVFEFVAIFETSLYPQLRTFLWIVTFRIKNTKWSKGLQVKIYHSTDWLLNCQGFIPPDSSWWRYHIHLAEWGKWGNMCNILWPNGHEISAFPSWIFSTVKSTQIQRCWNLSGRKSCAWKMNIQHQDANRVASDVQPMKSQDKHGSWVVETCLKGHRFMIHDHSCWCCLVSGMSMSTLQISLASNWLPNWQLSLSKRALNHDANLFPKSILDQHSP